MTPNKKPKSHSGPKPDVVRTPLAWKDAVKVALAKGKPPVDLPGKRKGRPSK